MGDDGALRVDAARSETRVLALVVDAGQGHRAVWVDGALGTARRAKEAGLAGADGLVVVRAWAALRVGAAGVRLARGRSRWQRWGRDMGVAIGCLDWMGLGERKIIEENIKI